jgi:hypothetical protein
MLRFSQLLAGEAFFYATSPVAKSFDSVYFLMNPRPEYSVHGENTENALGLPLTIEEGKVPACC